MARISKGRRAGMWAVASMLALGVATSAQAQTANLSTGLGQSWPNATDVSTNLHWHVYVFFLNGIEYVQVNDLNGVVHAAVGTAAGTAIVLPVGVDAANVTTTSAASTSSASSTVTVYSDNAITVTATPQSSGATTFSAAAVPAASGTCGSVYNCGGGRVN